MQTTKHQRHTNGKPCPERRRGIIRHVARVYIARKVLQSGRGFALKAEAPALLWRAPPSPRVNTSASNARENDNTRTPHTRSTTSRAHIPRARCEIGRARSLLAGPKKAGRQTAQVTRRASFGPAVSSGATHRHTKGNARISYTHTCTQTGHGVYTIGRPQRATAPLVRIPLPRRKNLFCM